MTTRKTAATTTILARNLRALRGSRSQDEIARQTGISRYAYYNIERQKQGFPRWSTLERLADVFGVSVEDLVYERGRIQCLRDEIRRVLCDPLWEDSGSLDWDDIREDVVVDQDFRNRLEDLVDSAIRFCVANREPFSRAQSSSQSPPRAPSQ